MNEGWRYKDGFRPRGGVPAAVVGAVIRELRDAGTLTASKYVEHATPTKSPIHDTIEWDDSVAAREYRLVQARRTIRACEEVVVTKGEEPRTIVVENVHVPDRIERGEGRYIASDQLLNNMDEFAEALTETRARFQSARSAYHRLERLTKDREDKSVIISIAAAGFAEVDRALSLLA